MRISYSLSSHDSAARRSEAISSGDGGIVHITRMDRAEVEGISSSWEKLHCTPAVSRAVTGCAAQTLELPSYHHTTTIFLSTAIQ